ncbi:hypothetical protein BLX41_29115 [Pseudomonas protegens]|uniref:hypothetical protein n=1 Tax=Pseudomonas protegens TaxID=380021 RepID=UPI000F4CE3D1|nr:hypothetical protein [Pseudomonas protegens]ROL63508.1 hypothetical protein BLX41_29115 [Pseudomonas protegens]
MQKGTPRRALLKGTAMALGAAVAGSLGGCLTSRLYEGRASNEVYTETVSQFYITADAKSFVILGKKYHYFVIVDPKLLQAIKSGLHGNMQAEFSQILVNAWQNLEGELTLRIPGLDQLDAQQIDEAKALGFVAARSQNALLHRYAIRGSRFESKRDISAYPANALNSTYTLNFSAYREKSKVGQVLLTPVTLTADGVLTILALPLLPVAFMAAQPFRVK